MPFKLPPLASLRLFEAAARLGGFRPAAAELNLTPSAVSHGIAALERWIGCALFRRQGRSVRLTPAGRDFLPYVTEGLSMIAVGAGRISPLQSAAPVAVSAAPTFASHWLLPRLPRFQARHPEIALCIDTSFRQVLFPLEEVDLAIRMGAGPWPGTEATLLFRESLVPLASPAYAESIRSVDGGIDWPRAVLLALTTVDHDWDSWLRRRGLAVQPRARLAFDTARLALDAAANGSGLVLGRLPLCGAEIAGGRLLALDPAPLAIETGYWLTLPGGGEPRREVKAFRQWLLAENDDDSDEADSSLESR